MDIVYYIKSMTPSMKGSVKSISIILPVHNEAENLPFLKDELLAVMKRLEGIETEVVFVDDGSTDGSVDILRRFATEDPRLKSIIFQRNFGQTAAMSCGIGVATGDVIIPMDADLQNDPADIPMLLEKIYEGFSCVSGWRKNRRDALWTRKIPSWIANKIISISTGVHIHDYGCSLKAYRSDVIKDVPLYGEMHRFIPAYAAWGGAKVTEIPVHHRPRMHGKSKYGLMRIFKVMLDLIVIKYLFRYFNRPMHFFGAIGFVSLFIGGIALTASVILKVLELRTFIETPLPIIGSMFVILSVQFVLTGLLAEVLMRTYYGSDQHHAYTVRERLNL